MSEPLFKLSVSVRLTPLFAHFASIDAAIPGPAGWAAQWPEDPGKRWAAVEENESGGPGRKRGEGSPN